MRLASLWRGKVGKSVSWRNPNVHFRRNPMLAGNTSDLVPPSPWGRQSVRGCFHPGVSGVSSVGGEGEGGGRGGQVTHRDMVGYFSFY